MAVASQWNASKPAMANQISADVPDIEENFEEIERILEAITNGTLGTTDSDLYAVDKIAVGSDADGDIYYRASSALARLAKGTAKQILTMNAGATAPEWVATGFNKNHITGLVLSNDTDTDHDINITAGEARDSTNAEDITLATEITKQGDAAWAVGDDAGGMDTGTIPASGTLHVWLIKRSDTGVVDVLFSISATAPTMPTNYDYKRRIGSYRTDASNNIINGDWWGTGYLRTFLFDTPILDVSTANPGTSAVTVALSVPGGIIVKALLNTSGSGNSNMYISALSNLDLAPSTTVAPLASAGTSDYSQNTQVSVMTNTSSQIRYRRSADNAIYLATFGWQDSL